MSRTSAFIASLLLITLIFTLPGCAIVGGIFKAGVWVGVLGVVIVVGIIIWLVSRSSGKN